MSNTQHGEPGDRMALPGRMFRKKEDGGPAQTQICSQAREEEKVAKGPGEEHPKDQEGTSETGGSQKAEEGGVSAGRSSRERR